MPFRVLIIGGTGQVGAAVVRALLAEPSCTHIVMVNRRASQGVSDSRLTQVVLDTSAASFPNDIAELARNAASHGEPVYGASCVGVGKGSAKWSEDALRALEVGVVGGFAQGCREGGIERFSLLSAAGSSPQSRIRYARVMGWKEQAVEHVGFAQLTIYRPGIIAGNAHTPDYVAWLGRLIPGQYGSIDQDDIGRAFVAGFRHAGSNHGVTRLGNRDMKSMAR